ncbi:PEP-CTERM sorting domain-containing protein [Paucibacter sp. DJ1R-11]|uniref:PEP-CTERM sorting domain-containing protein n=1 Tax=Paucibacter sp. DJ1R-11 TaxID=2893556 RepID=UPI0021E4D9EC|nr:PEP-CTERM sorting domain-containing protein [Paucibacter sp. DJ1R-11]MCV2361997.1 PEP-CTERM sorting domain-containing protein [Paucibacter sp. DJ1R-11]
MNNKLASHVRHTRSGPLSVKRRGAGALRRLPLSIALAVALSLVHVAPAAATTYTWTGLVDGQWATGRNWSVPCVVNGQSRTCFPFGENGSPTIGPFPAGSELLFNDNNANRTINGLPSGNLIEVNFTFGSNAGAFTFNPGTFGALALKGNIKNNSNKQQTFNFRFESRSDQTWDGGTGGLQLRNFGELNNALTLKNSVNLISYENTSTKVGTTGQGTLNIGANSKLAAPELLLGELYGGDGTVNLSASDAQLNLGGSLYVGRAGSGVLNITAGQTTAYQAFVGFNYGSQGTVLIDGTSSKLALNADLDVGRSSTGTVTVQNGGVLSSGNSFIGRALGGDGLVKLTGTGSSWVSTGTMSIGDAGVGSLRVEAGAKLSNVSATVGNLAGSVGTAKVSGTGSSWQLSGDLQIGNLGEASLFIEQGGQLSNRHSFLGAIGDPGTSRILVSGANSSLQSSGNLSVRSGSLDIRDGGKVSAQDVRLAESDAASALVNLSGEGAGLSVRGDLVIAGNDGSAIVNLGSGASLNSAGRLFIGRSGVLNLNGGTLTTGWASNAGQVNWNTGTVHFLGAVASGSGILGHSVGLGKDMNVLVDAALIIESGDDLSLNGGMVQAGGVRVEGELAVGSFSQLSVGAEGTRNNGALQMTGGKISSVGSFVNANYLAGHGVIAGTAGFSNTGLLQLSGGSFELASLGANSNTGNWDMLDARGLVLSGANLLNAGNMTLNGGTISGRATLVNGAEGTLSGRGVIATAFQNDGRLLVEGGNLRVAPYFTNNGQIVLNAATTSLSGAGLLNLGAVQGQGQVNAQIDNYGSIRAQGSGATLSLARVNNIRSGARIGILAADADATLLLKNGMASNFASIQLAGGTLDTNGYAMVNELGASLSGYGTLRSGPLSNKGEIFLSGGTSALRADIVASAGSKIILSGLSNTTFYGKLEVQDGAELRVSEGSVATFAAEVKQRNGSDVNGDGKMFFEGGLSIGNSPGYGYIQGSVTFAASNTYTAEIGGILACTALSCATGSPLVNDSFDKLSVGGNLRLGGKLVLTSWNGFVAQAGQSFDLLDWGTTSGVFKSIDASGFMLAAGTQLDYSQLYSSGTISVTAVPEPESYLMLLAGLGLLAWRRRKTD